MSARCRPSAISSLATTTSTRPRRPRARHWGTWRRSPALAPCARARFAKDCAGSRNTTSSIGISSSRAPQLAAAFAGFGLWWGAWASSLPAIRRGVGAGNGQLGLVLFAVALAALPAMVLTGRLAERIGPRLVPLTTATFAAAGMLPALAPSPALLFALLLLVGASTGAFDVAINVRVSAIEATHRVRVMDALHAAFSAGVVVGGIGAGLLRRA